MEENVFNFLAESQALMIEMDNLIDKYDLRDRVMSVVLQGVITHNEINPEEVSLQSIYNLNVDGQEEVDEIKDFIQDMWDSMKDNEDDDLNDLLDGTGISLN